MELEDKELHECQPPWYSESIRHSIAAFVVSVIVFVIAFALIPGIWNASQDLISWLLLLFLLLILIAFVALYAGLQLLRDNTDNWVVTLPYNLDLYHAINEGALAMLEQNGYIYDETQVLKLTSPEKDRVTKEKLVKAYFIIKRGAPSLRFEYGLMHIHSSDGPDSYYMSMRIDNVRLRNLQFAKFFHQDVLKMMDDIEYRRYKRKVNYFW